MAFGPIPDVGGNIAVMAMCASNCSAHITKVTPNPNGAYPGVPGQRYLQTNPGSRGIVADGNGSEGSPSGGWPGPACEQCPECGQCEAPSDNDGADSSTDSYLGLIMD